MTIDSSGYAATFDDKNVGTGKPVTVTGVTLSGAGAGDYTVSPADRVERQHHGQEPDDLGAVANNKGTTATTPPP